VNSYSGEVKLRHACIHEMMFINQLRINSEIRNDNLSYDESYGWKIKNKEDGMTPDCGCHAILFILNNKL